MSGMDYKKYAILYVDDEQQSLKYFPRLYGDTFRCLTAESVAQAREIVGREGDAVAVVISDQRMPGETGVDLLGWLRKSHPHVVRILTTAHSDLDSAIEAVNTGAIYRYVVKPWEERDMRGVMLRAMELHLLQRERDMLLREKLSTLQRVVVMDRVRSFAVLAAGLANRLRKPMLALKTFLENAPARTEVDTEDSHVQWGDLWQMAQHESQRVLELVQSVVRRTIEPEYHFKSGLALDPLLLQAVKRIQGASGIQLAVEKDAGAPAIAGDQRMLERMFDILAGRMLSLQPKGSKLTISYSGGATVWGSPGVRVRLSSSQAEWTPAQVGSLFAALAPQGGSEAEMDLLAAYFAAYHHAGNLSIHLKAPGPGFEVLLPTDPSSKSELPLERNWVESIFAFPEA